MTFRLASAVILLSCLPTIAHADDLRSRLTWSGEVSAVSDYRWRGVSLTDNDPAIQAGATVEHESGVYISVWAAAPTRRSADLELDLSIGAAIDLAGGTANVSLVRYYYPDLDEADYFNLSTSYEHVFGGWTGRGRFDYAPIQDNLTKDSVYAAIDAERSLGATPVSLLASVGWEKGFFTLDGEKWDYALGARYQIGTASLEIVYVDTDETAPAGEASVYGGGLVASIKTDF